jgi:hypothetical protein
MPVEFETFGQLLVIKQESLIGSLFKQIKITLYSLILVKELDLIIYQLVLKSNKIWLLIIQTL